MKKPAPRKASSPSAAVPTSPAPAAAPAPAPAPSTPAPPVYTPAQVAKAKAMAADLASSLCLCALSFAPLGFLPCDGSTVTVSAYPAAFAILGKKYGGDGKTTFALPDLRPLVSLSGGLSYLVPTAPKYPSQTSTDYTDSEFMGMVRLFKGATCPANFSFCDGTILPVNANQAMFALVGIIYGGNGVKTFALPDMRPQEKSLKGVRYIICRDGYFPSRC